MIAVLAPSKTMDFKNPFKSDIFSEPFFTEETESIVKVLKSMDEDKISDLMKVKPKLASEVKNFYSSFSMGKDKENLKQAAFAYKGDAFRGLSPEGYSHEDLIYAEDHLIILSALYGIVTPMTLIEPYRLEMGLKIDDFFEGRFSAFWKPMITEHLNNLFSERKSKVLINIASAEYMAAIDKRKLEAEIIEISFKQVRDGKLKTIGTLSKKARGLFASHIVKNRIERKEDLKLFKEEGYKFSNENSDEKILTYIKE